MDHVFEGNMVSTRPASIMRFAYRLTLNFSFQLDDINQLFLPHMCSKLMWFYQEVEEPEVPQLNDMVSADRPVVKSPRAGVRVLSVVLSRCRRRSIVNLLIKPHRRPAAMRRVRRAGESWKAVGWNLSNCRFRERGSGIEAL